MSGGDDLFRAYYVNKEAQYAPSLGEREDEIMVSLASTGGGVKWEFGIRQHSLGGRSTALRVEVFTDAWDAFTDCPDLFAALGAELGKGATLTQVRELLDRLGFRDITERETPAKYAR